jgi:hypothetical protein
MKGVAKLAEQVREEEVLEAASSKRSTNAQWRESRPVTSRPIGATATSDVEFFGLERQLLTGTPGPTLACA